MRIKTHSARAAVAALGMMTVLGACSADDIGLASTESFDPATSFDSDEAMSPEAMGDNGEQSGATTSSTGSATGDGDLQAAVAGAAGQEAPSSASILAGRQLARTARLELLVEDIDQAAARIRALVARLGGFVADAEIRGGEDGFGVITLRLPATQLDRAVDEIGEMASQVTLEQIGTVDLTDQLTDISTRVSNLEALETELRALMTDVRARSNSASELLAVFNQVNEVRLQIERLQAQQLGLADRVALATVTVDLQPVALVGPVIEDEPSTVTQALDATKAALQEFGNAAIWLALTIIPIGLLAIAPLGLAWVAYRSWRRGSSDTTNNTTAPTNTAV